MPVRITDKQRRYIEAIEQYGSARAAASHLGVHHSVVSRAVQLARKNMARADPSLHATEAPPGYLLRGVSTLLDAEGTPKLTWVKTKLDVEQRLELLKEAVQEIVDEHSGRLAPMAPPVSPDEDTLAVYPLADAHVGMHAWALEAGEDWDLKLARQTYCDTQDRLVASAPRAARALFVNLGDFLHIDNSSSRTERAGNLLDSDTRFAKIAGVAFHLQRRMIDRLLQKHAHVTVWNIAGNHDENTAIVISIAMAALYENEPRIEVSVDPSRFRMLEHGVGLIGASHGHTAPLKTLPGLMAAQWPEEWGRTRQRIWYTGHVHHDSSTEAHGCIVETLRTASPRDAWAAGRGYTAGRDMKCDVWHKDRGRIARLIQGVW